jgi:predicted glycosyltransferase
VVYDLGVKAWVDAHTRQPFNKEPHRQKLRKEEVEKTIRDYKPDIIIFEMYPFLTRFRDPDLDAVKEVYPDPANRPKIVCLSRDIIHSANAAETVEILNRDFDNVLVRGDGKLHKLEECMPEFKCITPPIENCGNIVSTMPIRESMPENERPVLVFSGGGYRNTDDAFFTQTIRSRKHSKTFSKNPWVITVSNNCTEAQFIKYREIAREEDPDGGIRITRPVDNKQFREMMANSAAAIVRSSYNTTFELVQSGVPFVVIPRSQMGYDQEQNVRARALESTGHAKFFHEENLKNDNAPSSLGDLLDEAAISRATSLVKFNFNGAERIATRIKELALEKPVTYETPGESVSDAHGIPAVENIHDRGVG